MHKRKHEDQSSSFFFCACVYAYVYACVCAATSENDIPLSLPFSSPKARSFWSAPRITKSRKVQHRKSAIHGLSVTLCMFRVKSGKLIAWEYETNSLRMLRKVTLPRGHDSWCWPKEARPLGSRMRSGITQAQGYLPHVDMFGQWKYWIQIA